MAFRGRIWACRSKWTSYDIMLCDCSELHKYIYIQHLYPLWILWTVYLCTLLDKFYAHLKSTHTYVSPCLFFIFTEYYTCLSHACFLTKETHWNPLCHPSALRLGTSISKVLLQTLQISSLSGASKKYDWFVVRLPWGKHNKYSRKPKPNERMDPENGTFICTKGDFLTFSYHSKSPL